MRVSDALARSGRGASAFCCSQIERIFFYWRIYFKNKLLTNTAQRPARRYLFELPAALSSPQSRHRRSARPLPARGLFPPLPRPPTLRTLETVTILSVLALGLPSPSQRGKGVLKVLVIVYVHWKLIPVLQVRQPVFNGGVGCGSLGRETERERGRVRVREKERARHAHY